MTSILYIKEKMQNTLFNDILKTVSEKLILCHKLTFFTLRINQENRVM